MSRPFIHIAGSKAAMQIATTSAKAFGIALGIGAFFQFSVFNEQKKQIAGYYNKHQ
jgi:predicted Kef-type K+ transport protein